MATCTNCHETKDATEMTALGTCKPCERVIQMSLGYLFEYMAENPDDDDEPVCEKCGHECGEDCTNCAGMKPGEPVCSICSRKKETLS